jgi:hypothetical protein
MQQTYWEKSKNNSVDFIQVNHNEVVIGSYIKTSSQGGGANSCSHEEFLNGKFHKHIKNYFRSKILNEVIDTVKNANKNPRFQKKIEKTNKRYDFIHSIPVDTGLKNLDKHTETVNGHDNYCNAGNYKTTIKSGNVTLHTKINNNYIESKRGYKTKVEIPGICNSVVEKRDYFFVVSNHNFFVISPKGELIYSTPDYDDIDNCIFGTQVRIQRVYKNNEIIFFRYTWFSKEHASGFIKYEIDKGLTGRWEIE